MGILTECRTNLLSLEEMENILIGLPSWVVATDLELTSDAKSAREFSMADKYASISSSL